MTSRPRSPRPRSSARSRLAWLWAGALLAIVLAGSAGARGGGALDPTFGGDGKVVTDFGGADESASALALQPDGKIVVAGLGRAAGTWIVARYNAEGSLDAGFGKGGRVETGFPGTQEAGASAVAVQPDGKVVAAGWAHPGGFLALARYNPDGNLDPSFGGDGRVLIADEPCSATSLTGVDGVGVAVAADGKLVVAGGRVCYSYPDNAYRNVDVVVARLNADGRLDAGFGGDGKVVTDFGAQEEAQALVLQPDGKAVISGWRVADLTRPGTDRAQDFLLARYNVDGSLDTSFGGNGRVLTDFGGNTADRAYAVAMQRDGRIVAAGGTCCSPVGFALARYNPDGSLDSSFDGHGRVVSEAPEGPAAVLASAVGIDRFGRILAAGRMYGGTSFDFAVVRYRSDGKVDKRFGTEGRVLTDFSSGSTTYDEAQAILVQPDGKLVVAGQTGPDYTGGDFALARYLPTFCLVPRVKGRTLAQAKREILGQDCGVGTIRRVHSRRVRRGLIVSQKPAPGAKIVEGAKVSLVISRGRKA